MWLKSEKHYEQMWRYQLDVNNELLKSIDSIKSAIPLE